MLLMISYALGTKQSKLGYFWLRNHLCERKAGPLQRELSTTQFLETHPKIDKCFGSKWI